MPPILKHACIFFRVWAITRITVCHFARRRTHVNKFEFFKVRNLFLVVRGVALADVCLLLGRTATMSPSHVLFFCLGAHFPGAVGGAFFLGTASEGDAVENDIIYVVTCKLIHVLLTSL